MKIFFHIASIILCVVFCIQVNAIGMIADELDAEWERQQLLSQSSEPIKPIEQVPVEQLIDEWRTNHREELRAELGLPLEDDSPAQQAHSRKVIDEWEANRRKELRAELGLPEPDKLPIQPYIPTKSYGMTADELDAWTVKLRKELYAEAGIPLDEPALEKEGLGDYDGKNHGRTFPNLAAEGVGGVLIILTIAWFVRRKKNRKKSNIGNVNLLASEIMNNHEAEDMFKKSLLSTWEWTKIFLLVTVVGASIAAAKGGSAAAVLKLLGYGGGAIILSIMIFIFYVIKNSRVLKTHTAYQTATERVQTKNISSTANKAVQNYKNIQKKKNENTYSTPKDLTPNPKVSESLQVKNMSHTASEAVENNKEVQLDMDALYEVLAKELKGENRYEGLWLEALDKNGFDENKAKSTYIQLRTKKEKKKIIELQQEENRLHEEKLLQERAEAIKEAFKVCPYCDAFVPSTQITCECGEELYSQPIYTDLDQYKAIKNGIK